MYILTASFVALLSYIKLATAAEVDSAGSSFTVELELAGVACGVFGGGIAKLSLNVVYETADRIHLKITDAANELYEASEAVFPRTTSQGVNSRNANIHSPLIFESQYLRLKTTLPTNPNIHGLGEYTNPVRLPPDNTTVTLWNRDTYGVPVGSNLNGDHPVYYEHRTTSTHGAFLLNSNGMDIKLRKEKSGHLLEYNVGGVLDMYFLAGSTSDPTAVTKQYSELTGRPAEVPYWSFGSQPAQNYVDMVGAISQYAATEIPLEVMWTDIDYMDRRSIFTVLDYFPMNSMREIVSYLHAHDQKYTVVTDPAVALANNYPAYTRGKEPDIFLKSTNGSDEIGLVWPGVIVYPDWFNPSTPTYWNEQFAEFYSPEKGLDIDGAWIDMNEPANFCVLPCDNLWAQAAEQELQPKPDVVLFSNTSEMVMREADIMNPPYAMNNTAEGGALLSKTAAVNANHVNGLLEYDVHNLYGQMISTATREAVLSR
ncbi:glycosyl hydrolases family 31-domain-containing protein [Cyathus striatus]|nr:glycosyl hydrolases family 31-domain-containing protein [Cyathus striatus]